MKNLILFLFIHLSYLVIGQAKKPDLMVVPAKDWCDQRGFLKTINNQGVTEYISDWEMATVKSSELNSVLTKMSAEMAKGGFKLQDLQQTIATVKNDRGEEAIRGNVSTNPIMEIRARAKSDIEIHVYWKLESQGPRKRIADFRLSGIDTYTNKVVATAQGSGDWASGDYTESELLIEAVQSKMDGFKATLQTTFDDMFKNGREITMNVYKTDNWSEDFTTEKFGGDELSFLISDWLAEKTVAGRFGSPTGDDTRMLITGIRIPLYNEKNQAMDAKEFARGFKNYLKTIGIPSDQITIDPVGQGRVNVFLGPK
jgi:hypothetical protein